MGARLFGTDGIRGIANAELTPELAFRLGEAAGHFLASRGQRGRIVVGRDTRVSGPMLEAALVAGITSSGADALLCGVVPTPAVALLVRGLGADGGVVISASHNAPEYNGIKLFSRQGFKLPDELEYEIEEFCLSREPLDRPTGVSVGGVMEVPDARERYVAHAVSTVEGDLSGLRVGVDCGHGAASLTTVEALERLGAEVTAINCDTEGAFINVGCGSTHLEQIAEIVRSRGLHLGIAHDGDADRVLAVDENGEEIDGDAIIAICATRMASEGTLAQSTVVSTVMANLGFDVAMREAGIRVVKTKVGDRYVLEQMLAMGLGLGGEQSGHIIFLEHNTTGDGLVTALQLAAAIRKDGRTASQVAQVMTRFPQVLVNVAVRDKSALATSERLLAAIRDEEMSLGTEGRVLVRASGTEPLVRVMAEAATQERAAAAVDRLAGIVAEELG